MLLELNSTQDIFIASKKHKLYSSLVKQLNKDFLYANIELDFNEDILPEQLKVNLHEIIYKLIQERFSEYLNLLYIIDVSEEKVKQLDGSDILKLSEQVTFLVLKRELDKVWLRHKFS